MTTAGSARRRTIAALIALSGVLLGLLAAAPAEAAKLNGPKRAQPGKMLRLFAGGFAPNAPISIVIQPGRVSPGNASGTALGRRFRTNAAGRARIRFRFRRRFRRCTPFGGCRPRRWRRHQRFEIMACQTIGFYGQQQICAKKRMRVFLPRKRRRRQRS